MLSATRKQISLNFASASVSEKPCEQHDITGRSVILVAKPCVPNRVSNATLDLPSGVASPTWTCESSEQRELNFMHYSPDRRTRVLFINSALLAGADTWIHLLLLRNLSQGQFELHAAGQPGSPASAFDELRAIPGNAI
jgi:hypothetical protein